MNSMNDQRFFDLAMKVIARQATDAEHAELEQLLATYPELRTEYERLRADVRVAKEALPLVEATQAGAGGFPAYARERLQTRVRQTLGQPVVEAPHDRGLGWGWRWVMGIAAAAVLVLLFVMRPDEGQLVIQIAMLDTAGDTRGSNTNELAALQKVWSATPIQSFDSTAALSAWENDAPANSAQSFAKITYDRTAGEVRVVGRIRGARFESNFPVDADLATTLRKADEFVRQQSSPDH
jgi:hypothetical protein